MMDPTRPPFQQQQPQPGQPISWAPPPPPPPPQQQQPQTYQPQPVYNNQQGYQQNGNVQGYQGYQQGQPGQGFYPPPQQQQQQQPFVPGSTPPLHHAQHYSPADFMQGYHPAAQIGLQFGTQALTAGQQYVNQNIEKLLPKSRVKTYFNVTTSYVLLKLCLILFPFRGKWWQRKMSRAYNETGENGQAQLTGSDNVHAPDLYIPVMAFVTYILLMGLVTGLKSSFHPDVLGRTLTFALILILAEVGLVKLGSYILSLGTDIQLLDSLALIGYNFVGLIISTLASIVGGRSLKYFTFLYCSVAMLVFSLRSLRPIFLPEQASAAGNTVVSQRKTRVQFMVGIALLQVAVSYVLLV